MAIRAAASTTPILNPHLTPKTAFEPQIRTTSGRTPLPSRHLSWSDPHACPYTIHSLALRSYGPAVICPLQEGLSLDGPARQVSLPAVLLELGNVTLHGLPPLDLAFVVFRPPAQIVPAVPLKPSPRILGVDPPLLNPIRKGLRCGYLEVVQRRIRTHGRKLGPLEPRRGELLTTVGHVLSTKDTQRQHLFWREIGRKLRVKTATRGARQQVAISPLHPIVYRYLLGFHTSSQDAPTDPQDDPPRGAEQGGVALCKRRHTSGPRGFERP